MLSNHLEYKVLNSIKITRLYIHFLIGLDKQYGPYAYSRYLTLISDLNPNKS